MVVLVNEHSLELEHILTVCVDLRHGRKIIVVCTLHLTFVIVSVDADDAIVIDREELSFIDDAVSPDKES